MSESLIHETVPNQMMALASLAEANCMDFQHQILVGNTQFAGPGFLDLFNFTTAENSGLILVSIDIKVLFDTTDATLGAGAADWRSSFDLNPYGPFAAGSGGVGQIDFLVNGLKQFSTTWDIGAMNVGVLYAIGGNQKVQLRANPNQPAGKKLQLVSRMNTFICKESLATDLEKKNTRIVTLS